MAEEEDDEDEEDEETGFSLSHMAHFAAVGVLEKVQTEQVQGRLLLPAEGVAALMVVVAAADVDEAEDEDPAAEPLGAAPVALGPPLTAIVAPA